MSDTLIKVEGVSKKFCRSLKRSLWYGMQDLGRELLGKRHGGDGELRKDEFWAIKDVSFEVKRGECLGLIGHNGAGKTTLLRMINGLIKPDSGRIELRGRVGGLIALGAGFNPVLTGRENISVNASILGLSKDEIAESIDSIIEFSGLSEFIDMPVQSYSSGMAVRLGFAIAIHSKPEILLLDEVLAVGDIEFQARCFNSLATLRESGSAFVVVSHNMHHIARYATKTLYLKKGIGTVHAQTSKAVANFQNDYSAENLTRLNTDWTAPIGTGEIQLTGYDLLRLGGHPTNRVRSDEPFLMEFHYRSSNHISKFYFDLVIEDARGLLFQGSSLDYGTDFSTTEEFGTVVIFFPCIPTTSAELTLHVALIESSTIKTIDWKRNIKISVEQIRPLTGRIDLNLSWQQK